MEFINIPGLIFMAVIMIPNIVFALKCKSGFGNAYHNKLVELLEQIGRYGSFIFMIFNIPGTSFGFLSNRAFALYLIVDSVLLTAYCLIWIVCFNKSGKFRALALSIIPSALFLFSAVVSRSVLLMLSAAVFAPCHITISYKNAVLMKAP